MRIAILAVSATALLALSACSDSESKPVDTLAPTTVASTLPSTTEAPLPTTTIAPTTTVKVVAPPSDEFMAFAAAHQAEVGVFLTSLDTFAGEAASYLTDVSTAPSAAATKTSADAVIALIPADTADADLMALKNVATSVSSAIATAQGGNPGAAVAPLVALQSSADAARVAELGAALAGA